ncbi:TolC family protein [Flavobacterium sp. Sd200]|uniref:TolC family protein n=1 Tax=Flavobacterium sp. Sd200 TaxID=2692211 RepID=UPI001368D5A2|nr:TolC family protein [Flavobacterium sp. Sd200]MXN90232.1 TolC family protein [Flavobacterium sp. Sd200]
MNQFSLRLIAIAITLTGCLCPLSKAVAQQEKPAQYTLSIEQALALARQNNDHVTAARLNSAVSESELKEIKSHVLPHVMLKGTAKRLTNAILFEGGGLTQPLSVSPPPAKYQMNTEIEASFNLYSGGKHEASIREYEVKTKLADVNVQQQEGSIALQVVQHYLEILRLNELDSLYNEQIEREKLRLKNINSLYKNGKVTRSDLLRAEINLSNQEYAKKETESDIAIYHNRLNILLHLPQQTYVVLSDTAVVNNIPQPKVLETPSEKGAFSLQQASLGIQLQQSRLEGAKSNYYPSIHIIAAYGLNFPNYLVYPYIPHAYEIGFVGLRLQYDISSLYHNNHKTAAERQRLEQVKVNEDAARDEILQQITSLQIKMDAMNKKMALARQNIEQSQVNYKIVNTKYFNQLALLTDLLEADNIYMQSKYGLIEAQTQFLNYYYQLLYTTGKI